MVASSRQPSAGQGGGAGDGRRVRGRDNRPGNGLPADGASGPMRAAGLRRSCGHVMRGLANQVDYPRVHRKVFRRIPL